LKRNAGREAGCAGFDAVLSLSKHRQKPLLNLRIRRVELAETETGTA